MDKRTLGDTGFSIAPIVFGGNVFGWTVDEKTSFALLDAFVDHGFNAIDTADSYSIWAPGNSGGESETIIGNWLKARPGMRDRVVIFTKVASDLGKPGQKGLSAKWITEEVENSLSRLNVDSIDLYFSHWMDPDTPQEETLGAYDRLVRDGKVKAIGASNHDADYLAKALKISAEQGLPAYQVVQPEYNLYDRDAFEGLLCDLCQESGLGVVTYFSLASGFLSGKYRSKADLGQSARGSRVEKYLDARGLAILDALDLASQNYSATPAEIALAWLIAKKGVAAPIASATKPAHLDSFVKAVELKLSDEDMQALDAAGAA